MKRFLPVLVLVALSLSPVRARACESLGVMGFPGSCESACGAHWMSAYFNTSCLWDILVDW